MGMYDAMFAAGLSVTQIAPNAWRTFIGAEILWGRLSGGNRQLTLDEFIYCYRPHHIASSKGTYHFNARDKNLRLVSDMPNSNKNWKSRYFFVEGTDWVCHQEEWATMPHGYFDNTWAFVRDLGQFRQPCSFRFLSDVTNNILFSSAYTRPHIIDEQEEFIRRGKSL